MFDVSVGILKLICAVSNKEYDSFVFVLKFFDIIK